MTNSDGSKVLTISLLCCGRPETTEKCLQSLMPIKEKIDCEIQVVDTGCSKETRAIIEKYADEVFDFKWCNDFAAARNEELKHAHGKWFLYLDDDEYFEKIDGLVELFSSNKYEEYNYGGYIQRNYVEPDGSVYMDITVGRMMKLEPETEFWGKVHEFMRPMHGNCIYLKDYVGHYGYCYASKEDNIRHSQRNIPLLKEMMEEDPDEFRWPYQLAQEYRSCDMHQELYDLCVESIERLGKDKAINPLRYRSTFVCGRAIAQEGLKKSEELIEDYEALLKQDDVFDIAKARVSLYAARAYSMSNQYEKCEKALEYYFRVDKEQGKDVAKTFFEDGIFMHDTFDDYHHSFAYSYYITCGYRKNDLGPLMKYYKLITWDKPRLSLDSYTVTGLLRIGLKQGNDAGINKVFDKMFERKPLKFFAQNDIRKLEVETDLNSLKKLKNCFRNTSDQKEMEAFMDARIYEYELLHNQFSGFGTARKLLNDFSSSVIKWYEIHKLELTDPDDKTNETTDYQLAKLLVEFDKNCDNNIKKSLETLMEGMKIYPLLNDALRDISKVYGDFQKVQAAKETDPDKFREMYDLEEAVLTQIAELEENGHGADAATTRGQLEGILMQTYGVKSLH